jgi:hypothetical protein
MSLIDDLLNPIGGRLILKKGHHGPAVQDAWFLGH